MTVTTVEQPMPEPPFLHAGNDLIGQRLRELIVAEALIQKHYATTAASREELHYLCEGLTETDKAMSTFGGLSSNLLSTMRTLSTNIYLPGETGERYAADIAPHIQSTARYMSVLAAQAVRYYDYPTSAVRAKYDRTLDRAASSLRKLGLSYKAFIDLKEKEQRAQHAEPRTEEQEERRKEQRKEQRDLELRLGYGLMKMINGRRDLMLPTLMRSPKEHLLLYHDGFNELYRATDASVIREERDHYGQVYGPRA